MTRQELLSLWYSLNWAVSVLFGILFFSASIFFSWLTAVVYCLGTGLKCWNDWASMKFDRNKNTRSSTSFTNNR